MCRDISEETDAQGSSAEMEAQERLCRDSSVETEPQEQKRVMAEGIAGTHRQKLLGGDKNEIFMD